MTVARLMREMPIQEFQRWKAWYQLREERRIEEQNAAELERHREARRRALEGEA